MSRERTKTKTMTLTTPDGIPVRCLYVRNIPKQAPPFEIKHLFSKYGTIKNFFLQSKSSLKFLTYAFITYETPEEAYKAYSAKSAIRYRMKKLFISSADSWHQPIAGPDGTINYNPRFIRGNNDENEANDEKEDDEEDQETEYNIQEEVNNAEDCPVTKLNDDCLLHIIDYIPFSQRHILGQVCRRWRSLMLSYWSKFTELNFKCSPFNQVLASEEHLKLYLRLCPNVTSVHLCATSFLSSTPTSVDHLAFLPKLHLSAQSIITTANLCNNLEELVLEGVSIVNRTIAFISHRCKHLKTLAIKDCELRRDDELNLIMKKCTKLESLSIANCTLFPGNWLKNLRPGLKTLSLLSCIVNPIYLSQGLPNLKDSLEEFEFVVDGQSYPFDFNWLHNFSKLESIVYVNGSMKYQKCSPNMFHNLKRLELECNNFVSDQILKGIVENSPNLTLLNLARSKHNHLTTEGYKTLANLTDLVTLNLSVNQIDNEVLKTLAEHTKNLEVLWLNSCTDITDSGCKSIVSNLMKLKKLYLDGCSKVTNKTVDAAIDAAIQNHDKVKLIIHAADTGITEAQTKSHAKVEISFSSRSLYSWMVSGNIPDFLMTIDDLEDEFSFDASEDDGIIDCIFSDQDSDYEFDDDDYIDPYFLLDLIM